MGEKNEIKELKDRIKMLEQIIELTDKVRELELKLNSNQVHYYPNAVTVPTLNFQSPPYGGTNGYR